MNNISKQEKLNTLIEAYLKDYDNTDVILAMVSHLLPAEIIEILEQRNGAKIIQIFPDEEVDDEAPEYIYE
jgi:hypothetical protein